MKKIFLALTIFSLSFSTSSYAGKSQPSPTDPGLSLSITGLYLQPSANNLTYAVYTQPLPLTTPNWTQIRLDPGYSPAINLALQYQFANPIQAKIDWFYLNTSNSSSISTATPNTSIAPPYYFGPLAQALSGTSAKSRAQFQVNSLGATVGYLLQFIPNLDLNSFVGINAGSLKQDLTSSYAGTDSTANLFSITSYNSSKFTGIGPRFGFIVGWMPTTHLGINAQIAGSLLAGVARTNTTFSSFGAGNKIPAYTRLANQSENQLVPEVDSKVEVSYFIPVKNKQSSLTLAVGYFFSAYINGITQVVPTTLVPGAFNGGSIAIETSAEIQSNLSLTGPYASLVWKF